MQKLAFLGISNTNIKIYQETKKKSNTNNYDCIGCREREFLGII